MDIQQNNGKQGVRTRHIDIRLTENEYEMIVEKAAECGCKRGLANQDGFTHFRMF